MTHVKILSQYSPHRIKENNKTRQSGLLPFLTMNPGTSLLYLNCLKYCFPKLDIFIYINVFIVICIYELITHFNYELLYEESFVFKLSFWIY
jgi:hypothetical protein